MPSRLNFRAFTRVSLISPLAALLYLSVKYVLIISGPSQGEELKGSLLVPFQWNSFLSSLSSPDMSHPYWQVPRVGLLENDILEMTAIYPLLVLHSTVTHRMTLHEFKLLQRDFGLCLHSPLWNSFLPIFAVQILLHCSSYHVPSLGVLHEWGFPTATVLPCPLLIPVTIYFY